MRAQERPELVRRRRRRRIAWIIVGVLVITSPAYWVVFLSKLDRTPPWFALPMVAIFLSITTLYAVSMFKLIGRINQLKRT